MDHKENKNIMHCRRLTCLAAFSSITRGTQTSISLNGKSRLTGSAIMAIDLITGTLNKKVFLWGKYHGTNACLRKIGLKITLKKCKELTVSSQEEARRRRRQRRTRRTRTRRRRRRKIKTKTYICSMIEITIFLYEILIVLEMSRVV